MGGEGRRGKGEGEENATIFHLLLFFLSELIGVAFKKSQGEEGLEFFFVYRNRNT